MLIRIVKKIRIDKPFFSWAFTMFLVNLIFDYTCISYNTVYTHVLYVIIFLALHYAGKRCANCGDKGGQHERISSGDIS